MAGGVRLAEHGGFGVRGGRSGNPTDTRASLRLVQELLMEEYSCTGGGKSRCRSSAAGIPWLVSALYPSHAPQCQ